MLAISLAAGEIITFVCQSAGFLLHYCVWVGEVDTSVSVSVYGMNGMNGTFMMRAGMENGELSWRGERMQLVMNRLHDRTSNGEKAFLHLGKLKWGYRLLGRLGVWASFLRLLGLG